MWAPNAGRKVDIKYAAAAKTENQYSAVHYNVEKKKKKFAELLVQTAEYLQWDCFMQSGDKKKSAPFNLLRLSSYAARELLSASLQEDGRAWRHAHLGLARNYLC